MNCNIRSLPYEILSSILQDAAALNARDAATYTYGLSQAPEPLQTVPVQKVVRGRVPPDVLRWRAADPIRRVCPEWHAWAVDYTLKEVYIRRWRGSERWLDSRNLTGVKNPSMMAVYRDPFFDLKETLNLFSQYPSLASDVRRLWFAGFHVSETCGYIFKILRHCNTLRSVTLPSIALRHGTAEDWSHLLGRSPGFGGIASLELLAVDLKESQRLSALNRMDHRALDCTSVDFSCLTRLKLFGDTNFMPLMDDDLRKMARTAINLKEVHVTGISSITIRGIMALVTSSKDSLRVLEYSPVSNDGFGHPDLTGTESDEHLCSILTGCRRLENLSISLPAICPDLFMSDTLNWKGEVQIRATRLCPAYQSLALSAEAQDKFWMMLDHARSLMAALASDLRIEIFISHWIFEPQHNVVHGNFDLAEALSDFAWPASKSMSGKGPYGQTGLYGSGKDEGPYSCVSEDDFRDGLRQSYVSF